VRSYADYLGLNHTEITKRFKEEVLGSKDDADLVMPAPLPEEGVPKARILVFAFGLILLALVGWRLWGKEKITKIPRVTLSERSKGETKNFHAKIHQDVHPQMAKTFLQSNSIDIYSKTVAESSKSPEETKVSTVSSKITLRATELSWIEVRTHDGSILLSKTLNPGESQKIPHNEGLLLTTGNAGGITISLAGEQAMPLGNSGEVLRHIPLTKAGISAVSHHYKVKLVK
jgi:cytoskeleton protein RodZ